MGRILWAWCFSWLLVLGFAASARADDFSIIRVCARPKGIPANVERWALTPSGTFLVTKNPDDFRQKTKGLTIFVFDPAAPPSSVGLLPIPHNKVQCAPYKPPAPAPPPPPGAVAPPAKPASGARGGEKPAPAKERAATRAEDEPPPGLPPPIVYPQHDPEPRPQPPPNGVTAHWPRTVLPIKRMQVDTHTRVLPMAHVLPVEREQVDRHTRVLPMAHVLPWKHDVNGLARGSGKGEGGEGDGGDGKAPNRVAKKTALDKFAENTALLGGIAGQELDADLNRPDGKQYGIPGGESQDGPNHPVAQASAGTAHIIIAVLTAGGLDKKLKDALSKKGNRLVIKGTGKTGEKAAEKCIQEYVGDATGKQAADRIDELVDAMHKSGAIGEYSVMAKFTQGMGGQVQAHHILEKSLAEKFKRELKIVSTDTIPSVILSDVEHKAMTAELKAAGTEKAKNMQELWKAYQKAYRKHPDWLEAIEPYFVKSK